MQKQDEPPHQLYTAVDPLLVHPIGLVTLALLSQKIRISAGSAGKVPWVWCQLPCIGL